MEESINSEYCLRWLKRELGVEFVKQHIGMLEQTMNI